ncbi:hypothetical protein HMPREF1981_03130 [Bacteroides pyogenes F0041]|uniref:Uncharacterized protein n=1 Tax=Bacteroides pyogenes F0041 TaxID=1321819 RepID=U2CAD7_9BACE|nr:hypothetical protein HMPREF1981_03130 [Bacteroides pyogenes F0041]
MIYFRFSHQAIKICENTFGFFLYQRKIKRSTVISPYKRN